MVVVAVCGSNLPAGVPWVIPIVLGILGAWTVLLQRTRFGRYVYAIGGNAEAARRAGVNLAATRTWCFVLCSATSGFGGILLGSFFYGQYSSNTGDPGQLVLYSVAAAVIGGTSLFGGRGKPIHGENFPRRLNTYSPEPCSWPPCWSMSRRGVEPAPGA